MSEKRSPALGFLAVAVFVVVAIALGAGSGACSGQLADTDAYSWANRAVELRDGGWFDERIDGVAPGGHVQHWSRPFDVLVIAGATVLAPFAEFDRGITIWAFVLPVMLGGAAIAVLWATFCDSMDRRSRVALCALLAGQAPIFVAFLPGRIDHQALYVPLVSLLVLLASRHVAGEGSDRGGHGVVVGMLGGLCLWVAMETILVVGAVLVVYGFRWVLGVDSTTRRLANVLIGLSISTAAALFVENGSAALDRRPFDELSWVFPLFFVLAILGAVLLERLEPGTGLPRFGAAVGVGVVVAGVALVAFPSILSGPLGEVDALYADVRLVNINEIQPVVASSVDQTLTRFAAAFYFAPLAVVSLVVSVRRGGPVRWFAKSTGPWQFAAAVTVLYLPLTLWQMRWAPILAIFSAPFAATLLGRTLWPKREIAQLVVALALAYSWIAVLVLVGAEPVDRCEPSGLSDVASAMEGNAHGTMLAMTDYGPQLLFETDYEVLSIPNHRYQAGFKPSFEIFNSSDDEFQRSIVETYDVQAVLVCTSETDTAFYRAEAGSLHEQLQDGTPPVWLSETGDFRTLDDSPYFRLFEVDVAELTRAS